MQLSRLNPRIIILSFFIMVFFGLCSKAEGQEHKPRGEIRVVESWRPDLNILGHNVLQYLYEYALDRNEMVPCLAVSRRWIDNTTLELKLREGVRFHNGEVFDADAVKFNFEYQRKHNPGRGVQVYMKGVREIRIIDPHSIQIVLDRPDSLILQKLIMGPVGGWVIGAPQYMEQVGWTEFLKRPAGTGPFVVEGEIRDYRKELQGGVYATLVANLDYWDAERPKLKKIEFVRFSPSEAVNALLEGRVDLVTALIPKDTLKVAESTRSKVVKGRGEDRWMSGVLNLLSPHTMPLRDLRVRKALNYAVNKNEGTVKFFV
jgi:peptide/nickel transport system substrate-binding protein